VNNDYGSIDPLTGQIDLTTANNTRSVIAQDSYGFAVQLSATGKLAGMNNQLTAGVSGDFANARFSHSTIRTRSSPLIARPWVPTTTRCKQMRLHAIATLACL